MGWGAASPVEGKGGSEREGGEGGRMNAFDVYQLKW